MKILVDAREEPVPHDFFLEHPFPVSYPEITRAEYLESLDQIHSSTLLFSVNHGTLSYAVDEPFAASITVATFTEGCKRD